MQVVVVLTFFIFTFRGYKTHFRDFDGIQIVILNMWNEVIRQDEEGKQECADLHRSTIGESHHMGYPVDHLLTSMALKIISL